jgi:TatD DNase family protein
MPSPTLLFDSHLHLDPEDDPPALFASGRDAGVGLFLVAGGNLAAAEQAQRLSQQEPGVYAASGLHPHEASTLGADLDRYRALLRRPGVVAVGEIGLDYHYDHSPRAVQRRVFETFLDMAVAEARPAIVHCRDAHPDCVAILREFQRRGLRFQLHSFTGAPAEAETFLAMGALLSFNGIATFPKGENVRDVLRLVPLDRLLVETDAPWLAPVPHRGKRNCPAYLPDIVACIAAVRALSFEDVARATTENGKRLFGIHDASQPVTGGRL